MWKRRQEFDYARIVRQYVDPDQQGSIQVACVKKTPRLSNLFLDASGWVLPGPAGAIGYCMGGRHVLCVAGSFPERIRAAACLHGAYLVNDHPNSPHLLARRARGEIYCGHAELDKYAPADVVRTVDEALAGSTLRIYSVVHQGAQHAYAIPDRHVYDPRAAEIDWENIGAMLQRQLALISEPWQVCIARRLFTWPCERCSPILLRQLHATAPGDPKPVM